MAREADDGGPIEVRLVLEGGSIDFRGAEVEGVPVRLEVAEEAEETSCLVGDLLGDCHRVSKRPLHRRQRTLTARRETLDAGVGLGALMLCRLVALGSTKLCLLYPPATMLDGLGFGTVPLGFAVGRLTAFGGVGSSIVTAAGLTNMPRPGGQSKYR